MPDPSDDVLLQRPIIIVGAPRSGTSFLGWALECHEQLVYADEPRLTWRYGNDSKSDMLSPADARPNVVRYIRKTFAQRVREAGGSRLLEKTPSNGLRLPFVDRVFPDALYIHTIRNGLESALSIRNFWQKHAQGVGNVTQGRVSSRAKELSLWRAPYYLPEFIRRAAPESLRGILGQNPWGPRLPGMRAMLREMDVLDVCCLQWRTCVELACQFGRSLPADRYLELRVEDMSEDTMRRVLGFCGLPESQAVWDWFGENHRPRQDKARPSDSVQEEDRRRVLQWIEPTLRWLNYDVPD